MIYQIDIISQRFIIANSKGKLFRKRKVRVPKNAKHLIHKDKSPKSSSDEDTKKKK